MRFREKIEAARQARIECDLRAYDMESARAVMLDGWPDYREDIPEWSGSQDATRKAIFLREYARFVAAEARRKRAHPWHIRTLGAIAYIMKFNKEKRAS